MKKTRIIRDRQWGTLFMKNNHLCLGQKKSEECELRSSRFCVGLNLSVC